MIASTQGTDVPIDDTVGSSRLLAWTATATATLSPSAQTSAQMATWEALDQGRWLPRALRCWRTATFEPPPLDQNPDEPSLKDGEVLLQSLVWLACVDQALNAFPDLDHVTMEPQGRPGSTGGPTVTLPPVMLWQTMRSTNDWLVVPEDVALPSVDGMFAGFKPALAHPSSTVQEAVLAQIQRLGRKEAHGKYPADGLNRKSLPYRAAQSLGLALCTLVHQHEERRVLHASFDDDPTLGPCALPTRPRL